MLGIYEQIFGNSDYQRLARWLRLGLFMLAYFLLVLAGTRLSSMEDAVVAPWFAGPMAIAGLVRLHPRDWAIPMVGILLADVLAQYLCHTPHEVLLYTFVNGLEILGGAFWLRWQFKGVLITSSVSSFLSILLIGAFLIPLISSLMLALTVSLPETGFFQSWWIHYLSGCLGMLIMLPVALKSSIGRWRELLSSRILNGFNAVLLLTVAVNAVIILFFPDEVTWSIGMLLLGALLFDFFRSTLLNIVSVSSLVVLVHFYQQDDAVHIGMFHYITIVLTVLPALLLAMALHDFRREQLRLQQSEQRWKSALEGSGQGVWEIDLVRRQISASLEAHRMLGEEAGASFSMDLWREKTHPDDVAHVEQALAAHIAGETPLYVVQYRARQKDGSYRWYQSRGKVMQFDELDRPLQMVGTLIDIHAARQLELEREQLAHDLQEEKERLQVTLDSIGDGVIATDMAGNVVFMNPVAEEITGWNFSRARQCPLQEVFHLHGPDMAPQSLELINTCLSRNEAV
ncbi:PAS domain-containing protein [Kushneria marisflavi]|uniref:histidine kinase n=1 Tax=Kushneria marisflavi TaxID=157779 RepID=A0A240UN25_9GAMM|nr:PAS domain-containing protein [Kushneria marisflavi]ART62525.1 hypothetical protein B9H00_05230 [Kushneria marisflavi]RKD84102.1 PAS domain S-box-containing protein [Kushneria marisflavi]